MRPSQTQSVCNQSWMKKNEQHLQKWAFGPGLRSAVFMSSRKVQNENVEAGVLGRMSSFVDINCPDGEHGQQNHKAMK
jgi:hypothetical protein